MTRPVRTVTAGGDDFDQISRKRSFQAPHPEIFIGLIASATLQARIPEEDGETIITRWYLRDLLDELDKRYAPAITDGTHQEGSPEK